MPQIAEVSAEFISIVDFPDAMAGERIALPGDAVGQIVRLERDRAIALRFDPHIEAAVGDPVEGTGCLLEIAMSPALGGRLIDPLGRPLDGGAPLVGPSVEIHPRPLRWLEVATPIEPLWTGVPQVDLLACLLRGESTAITGESGPSTLAQTALLSAAGEGLRCIYVSERDTAHTTAVIDALRAHEALWPSITAVHSPSMPLRGLCAAAGMAIAEAERAQFRHALVVLDSAAQCPLSEITPRAGRFAAGGSVTLLVVTSAAEARAQQWPRWFAFHEGERRIDLATAGYRPFSFPPPRGGWGKHLSLAIANHHELVLLMARGVALDPPSVQQLQRGERVWALLKRQGPMPIEDQIAAAYTIIHSEHLTADAIIEHLHLHDSKLRSDIRRAVGLRNGLRERLDAVIAVLTASRSSSSDALGARPLELERNSNGDNDPMPNDGRPISQLLDKYASDHQNPTNQRIHTLCVPLILWTTVALVWPIPLPMLGAPGIVAGILMLVVVAYYVRLSPVLAAAMTAIFAVCGVVSHGLLLALGPAGTWMTAGVVFALAWVAQFVGHKIEGKRPSFLTDLTYLLIGPLWVVAKGLRRAGVAY